jgi:hypothetical protein
MVTCGAAGGGDAGRAVGGGVHPGGGSNALLLSARGADTGSGGRTGTDDRPAVAVATCGGVAGGGVQPGGGSNALLLSARGPTVGSGA